MAGIKRSWQGQPIVHPESSTATTSTTATMSSTSAHVDEPSSQVLAMFGHFRDELDEHHDRRERIIKASRDITALSKKMYELLAQPITRRLTY